MTNKINYLGYCENRFLSKYLKKKAKHLIQICSSQEYNIIS